MARISELHYSNAYARNSGVEEFLEVALSPGEDPADFVVSFYEADGSVGIEIPLTHADVQVTFDPVSGETAYVISAANFPILLTDPNGSGTGNYEAYALTNVDSGEVIDFYDIGSGTTNILALDGAAAGETSENLAVLVGPESTTTTLQFNLPNPDTLTYGTVDPGATGIACFVEGALIETAEGPKRIETLQEGDLVLTRDNGVQPLRWIGSRTVSGHGEFAPVRFPKGVLGAERDHYLSQQHRVLVTGWMAELLCGELEVLVPAKALARGGPGIIEPRDEVTYFHLLFETHQIVVADGVESESFFPGEYGVAGFDSETREEVLALFPELSMAGTYGSTARQAVSMREGVALAAMI